MNQDPFLQGSSKSRGVTPRPDESEENGPTSTSFTNLQGQLSAENRRVFPDGLEQLLKKIPDGQIVLLKRLGLDNRTRGKLVKIIIDYLMIQNNPNLKFPDVLGDAAEEIVGLFPGERRETYYIPYIRKSSHSSTGILPKGKLYSRWANLKSAMRAAKGETRTVEDSSEKPEQIILSDEEKISYDLVLNSSGSSPDQIFINWKTSHRMRMIKIKTFDTPLAYFNAFPFLKTPRGYQFLIEDFKIKFPHAKDKTIKNVWPQVAPTVIEILRNKQILTPELYSSDIDEMVLSLKYLPHLFLSTVLRNKLVNRIYRLTKAEMAERFFLHVDAFTELESKLEERMDKLKESNMTIQPFLVAVGPLKKVHAYFVVLNTESYLFNDCLTALDTAFKIFFALDLPFPAETKAIWQTIDRLAYNVGKYLDPTASVVLSEIEPKIKKE